MELGVNIDHVATLRNARGGEEPSVLDAAIIAQRCNASAIKKIAATSKTKI